MPPSPGPRGTPGAGYRPWLDGIRAVAITLVFARHLRFGWSSHAGGPGVALFFALSGYLITGLLLEQAGRGAVDLAGFYLRRAARLLPALVVMLAVADLWFGLHGRRGLVRESLSVLLYVKNYRDVVAGNPGLFGQCWSLSVEEHFYLLWPLPLLLLARRRPPRDLAHVALALAVLALAWRCALVAAFGTGRLLYVDTFSRADSLLVGCALAAAVRDGLRVPPAVTLAAALTYAWVVSPVGHAPLSEQTVGYSVQSVACGLLVAGIDTADSPVRRALSQPPVVTLGVLSYSLYLWHNPVLAAIPLPLGWRRDVLAVAVSLALAAASYRLVEMPARARGRRIADAVGARARARRAPASAGLAAGLRGGLDRCGRQRLRGVGQQRPGVVGNGLGGVERGDGGRLLGWVGPGHRFDGRGGHVVVLPARVDATRPRARPPVPGGLFPAQPALCDGDPEEERGRWRP